MNFSRQIPELWRSAPDNHPNDNEPSSMGARELLSFPENPRKEASVAEVCPETTVIEGARVILPGGVEAVSVRIEDGRIAALDGARDGARVIDGRGLTLAPALVDIHGDAFERQMAPRTATPMPLDVALLETDRQLAANGIATAYHALTLSWEPGLRSVETGTAVVDTLAALTPRLLVENRIQLRWETFCEAAIPLIERALTGPLLPAIAFNDHTTMGMRAIDLPVTQRAFRATPGMMADLDDPRLVSRFASQASRAGMDDAAFMDLLARVWARRDAVEADIEQVAAMGRAAGAPMLSHDDCEAAMRLYFADLGARISEFPMDRAIAAEARERGEWIVLGAPNALRGGSHIGSLGAAEMIADGLCDILASDYYYPAMLGAVGRMAAKTAIPLARLWATISTNPADALGLHDRGRIEVGRRADLVLLDWPQGGTPVMRCLWVAGRLAAAAQPADR